ncbi:MAG: type II toxin-antitoxin system Phd/YefM family antitoxin [Ghiorsea sp.]|nr:type II toxin-antitoxin system Phd/YefM family antitoxin [Ghiorsea sp.]MDQ7004987.1 type II toxin-antitoxin system Phd/YefM family antitoxin [Ghiorsea sp.]
MNVVRANDLKLRGVSSLEEGLENEREVMITVRGKVQYVVMRVEQYHHLRETELEAALLEARNDLMLGNSTTESAEAHVERVFP